MEIINPRGIDAYSRLILDELNANSRHPQSNYLNQDTFKNFVENDFDVDQDLNAYDQPVDVDVSALVFAIMLGIEKSLLTYFENAERQNNNRLMTYCPHEITPLLRSFQTGGGFTNKLISHVKQQANAKKNQVMGQVKNKVATKVDQLKRKYNEINAMEEPQSANKNASNVDSEYPAQLPQFKLPTMMSLSQMAKTLGVKIPDDFILRKGEAEALTEEEKQASIWSFPLNSLDMNLSYAAKAFMKRILQVSDFFVAKIIDYATNNVYDKPYDELMPYMKYRTMAFASYLDALSKDEEQIEALKDIARSIGSIGEKVLGVFKESAERMVGKLNAAIVSLSEQSTAGAMKAATSVAGAIIGNIPVLGGIINLIITLGLIFNNVTSIGKEMTSSFGDLILDGVQSAKRFYEPIKESKSQILNSLQQVFLKKYGPEIYKRIGKLNVNIPSKYTFPPGETEPSAPAYTDVEYEPPIKPSEFVSYQDGGGHRAMKATLLKHKNRKLIKKMNNTRRRLRQTLNRFHYGKSGKGTRRKI